MTRKYPCKLLAILILVSIVALAPIVAMPITPKNTPKFAEMLEDKTTFSSNIEVYDIIINEANVTRDVQIYGSARVLINNSVINGDLSIRGYTTTVIINTVIKGHLSIGSQAIVVLDNVTAGEVFCEQNTIVNMTNLVADYIEVSSKGFKAENVTISYEFWIETYEIVPQYIILRNIYSPQVYLSIGLSIHAEDRVDLLVLDNVANLSSVDFILVRELEILRMNISNLYIDVEAHAYIRDSFLGEAYISGKGAVDIDNVTVTSSLNIGQETFPYSDLTVNIYNSDISSLLVRDFGNISVRSSHISYLEDLYYYRSTSVTVNEAGIIPEPTDNYYVNLDASTTYDNRNITGIIVEDGELFIENVNGDALGLAKYGALRSSVILRNVSSILIGLKDSDLIINDTSLNDVDIASIRGSLSIIPYAIDNHNIEIIDSNLTDTNIYGYSSTIYLDGTNASVGCGIAVILGTIIINDSLVDYVTAFQSILEIASTTVNGIETYNATLGIINLNAFQAELRNSNGTITSSMIHELTLYQENGVLNIESTNITNLFAIRIDVTGNKHLEIENSRLVSGADSIEVKGAVLVNSNITYVYFDELYIEDASALINNTYMSAYASIRAINSEVTIIGSSSPDIYGSVDWEFENVLLNVTDSYLPNVRLKLNDSEAILTRSGVYGILAFSSKITMNESDIYFIAYYYWPPIYAPGIAELYESIIIMENSGKIFNGSGGTIILMDNSSATIYNSSIYSITIGRESHAELNDTEVVMNIQYNLYAYSDFNITSGVIAGSLEVPVIYSDNVTFSNIVEAGIEIYGGSYVMINDSNIDYALYIYDGIVDAWNSEIPGISVYESSRFSGIGTVVNYLEVYGYGYVLLRNVTAIKVTGFSTALIDIWESEIVSVLAADNSTISIYGSKLEEVDVSASGTLVIEDTTVESLYADDQRVIRLSNAVVNKMFLGTNVTAEIRNSEVGVLSIHYPYELTLKDIGSVNVIDSVINSSEVLSYTGDELYFEYNNLAGEYVEHTTFSGGTVYEKNITCAFLNISIGRILYSTVFSVIINSQGDKEAPIITVITTPTEIINGTTGNYAVFVVSDPHLSKVAITINNTLIYENTTPQENQVVNVSLDNLEIGTYTITVTGVDSLGNTASLTVVITVTAQPIKPPEEHPPPSPIGISMIIAIVIGIVGIGVVVLIALKYARKK